MKENTVHEFLKQNFCAALYGVVLTETCGIHMEFIKSIQSQIASSPFRCSTCPDILEFNYLVHHSVQLQ